MIFCPLGALFSFPAAAVPPNHVGLVRIHEACKAGHLEETRGLLGILRQPAGIDLVGSALTLLTYAMPRPLLRELVPQLHAVLFDDKDLLCETLVSTGLLDLAEIGADLYGQIERDTDRGGFPEYISLTLEAQEKGSWNELFFGPDPVFGESSEFDCAPLAPVGFEIAAYVALVKRRIAVLRLELGGDHLAVYNGRSLDLVVLARTLLDSSYDAQVIAGRCILEASTGFDLAAFTSPDGVLRRARALDAVRELQRSVDLSRFEPGVRYFFGHRLPD
jgi:hypothetical protein